MRPAMVRYLKALRPRLAPLHGESGASTLEWLGLSAAVLVLAGAIVLSLQASSGGPVPGAIEQTVSSLVRGILTGDGGGVKEPEAKEPGIEEPNANEPGITGHATGLAALLARWAPAPSDDDGRDGAGGSWWDRLWGTVEDRWNAFWGAVGDAASWTWDRVSAAWDSFVAWWNSESANLFKSLLTTLAAALVIIVAVVVLVAVGLVIVEVAIVIVIVVLVLAVAIGLWYGLTQVQGVFDSDDFWKLFTMSLFFCGLAALAVWAVASGGGPVALSLALRSALSRLGPWIAGRVWPSIARSALSLALRAKILATVGTRGGRILNRFLTRLLGRRTPYEIARAGERHAGHLRNYANHPSAQISKGIRRYHWRVAEHLDKIKNPSKHVPDWDKKSIQQQLHTLREWAEHAQRNGELADLFEDLLKSRRGGP